MTGIKQYRPKTGIIEAMQFDGSVKSAQAIGDWIRRNRLPNSCIIFAFSHEAGEVNNVQLYGPGSDEPTPVHKDDIVYHGLNGVFYCTSPFWFAENFVEI